MNKNIILIGMSGTGKTTIAKELSKFLKGYDLVDIDTEIENYSSQKISDIFEEFGESFFRTLEKDIIKRVAKKSVEQIISTGGGAFEDDTNRKNLLENGIVVYLKASAQEIYNRIVESKTDNRPLLKGLSVDKIKAIMDKRIPNYEKAHYIIDTNNKTPYNICKEIIELCQK